MQTEVYSVELDDGTVVWLPAESWYQVVRTGLRECGYLKNRELRYMSMSAGSPSGSRGRESRNGCGGRNTFLILWQSSLQMWRRQEIWNMRKSI